MKTFHITLTVSENWIDDGFNIPDSGVFDDFARQIHHLNEYATANEVRVQVREGEHILTADERAVRMVDDEEA